MTLISAASQSVQVPGRRARCALVSTFPPTECGIATFSKALTGGFADIGANVDVVRLVPGPQRRPRGVAWNWVVDPGNAAGSAARSATATTASMLNQYDVVILQHEYGIYGGADGDDVLHLMRSLTAPVVSVLHTVLSRPTPRQHAVLAEVIRRSSLVVTMTRTARERAVSTYGASDARAVVIPHGAAEDLVTPAVPQVVPARPEAGPVVLTWGLLGRGKGIEWGIRAMASLADLRPEYVVAGRTHPRLGARDGAGYRKELVALAAELGVAASVVFDDRYLDAATLHALVRGADVVLLPYDSLEQVTSGVLTEAIAAGRPVVSTRFPHAVELLSGGAGLLVDRADPAGIATAVRRVFTDPDLAASLSRRAHRIGAGLTWRAVAAEYVAVCNGIRPRSRGRAVGLGRQREQPAVFPDHHRIAAG